MFTTDPHFFEIFFNLLGNRVNISFICYSPKLIFLTNNIVRSHANSSRIQHQRLSHLSFLLNFIALAFKIVSLCFVIFELSFLLLTISAIDMEPNQAARPAKGGPAIIPIPLRAAASTAW